MFQTLLKNCCTLPNAANSLNYKESKSDEKIRLEPKLGHSDENDLISVILFRTFGHQANIIVFC